MAEFTAEVPHQLGLAEATNRIKDFLEQTQERFRDHVTAADGEWNDNVLGFSLTTNGVTVNGSVVVEEDTVRVVGHLPLIALPFRGVIQKSIANELAQALV